MFFFHIGFGINSIKSLLYNFADDLTFVWSTARAKPDSFILYDPPTSGGSMAVTAILAKGSHEGILILDGTNRVTAATVVAARADSATDGQAIGADGIARRR